MKITLFIFVDEDGDFNCVPLSSRLKLWELVFDNLDYYFSDRQENEDLLKYTETEFVNLPEEQIASILQEYKEQGRCDLMEIDI